MEVREKQHEEITNDRNYDAICTLISLPVWGLENFKPLIFFLHGVRIVAWRVISDKNRFWQKIADLFVLKVLCLLLYFIWYDNCYFWNQAWTSQGHKEWILLRRAISLWTLTASSLNPIPSVSVQARDFLLCYWSKFHRFDYWLTFFFVELSFRTYSHLKFLLSPFHWHVLVASFKTWCTTSLRDQKGNFVF